jgi:hypothetical protein
LQSSGVGGPHLAGLSIGLATLIQHDGGFDFFSGGAAGQTINGNIDGCDASFAAALSCATLNPDRLNLGSGNRAEFVNKFVQGLDPSYAGQIILPGTELDLSVNINSDTQNNLLSALISAGPYDRFILADRRPLDSLFALNSSDGAVDLAFLTPAYLFDAGYLVNDPNFAHTTDIGELNGIGSGPLEGGVIHSKADPTLFDAEFAVFNGLTNITFGFDLNTGAYLRRHKASKLSV